MDSTLRLHADSWLSTTRTVTVWLTPCFVSLVTYSTNACDLALTFQCPELSECVILLWSAPIFTVIYYMVRSHERRADRHWPVTTETAKHRLALSARLYLVFLCFMSLDLVLTHKLNYLGCTSMSLTGFDSQGSWLYWMFYWRLASGRTIWHDPRVTLFTTWMTQNTSYASVNVNTPKHCAPTNTNTNLCNALSSKCGLLRVWQVFEMIERLGFVSSVYRNFWERLQYRVLQSKNRGRQDNGNLLRLFYDLYS